MNFMIYIVNGRRIAWFERKISDDERKCLSHPQYGIGFDIVDYRKPGKKVTMLFKGELVEASIPAWQS
tara:strand:- start:267 stop:470 length:204 start_codon:yes stop_codon:yes gene_type:complete